jgi:hypothetical protein
MQQGGNEMAAGKNRESGQQEVISRKTTPLLYPLPRGEDDRESAPPSA